MSGELSGQVAIVTGGASGIGAASAALLAGQGARVIVADLQDAKDGAGRFVQHDVTSEESWKALLADVLGSEGRLDIMVNNAGISGGFGNVETTTVENWQHVQAINSEGVFLGCKYAIQGMKKTGPDKPASKGSIVNISSIAGLIGSARPDRLYRQQGRGAAAQQERGALLRRAEIRHPLQLGASRRRRHADLQSAVADDGPRAGQGVPRLAPSDRPHGRAASISARSCCGSPRTARASSPARRSWPTAG